MRVAAKAFDFEIEITSVEGVAEGWGWLGGSLKAEHALVPGFAGELIRFLACPNSPLGRCPDRAAVDGFSGFGSHCSYESGTSADVQIINQLGIEPLAGYWSSWVWVNPNPASNTSFRDARPRAERDCQFVSVVRLVRALIVRHTYNKQFIA